MKRTLTKTIAVIIVSLLFTSCEDLYNMIVGEEHLTGPISEYMSSLKGEWTLDKVGHETYLDGDVERVELPNPLIESSIETMEIKADESITFKFNKPTLHITNILSSESYHYEEVRELVNSFTFSKNSNYTKLLYEEPDGNEPDYEYTTTWAGTSGGNNFQFSFYGYDNDEPEVKRIILKIENSIGFLYYEFTPKK